MASAGRPRVLVRICQLGRAGLRGRYKTKGRNRLHGDLFSCIKERFSSDNHGIGCPF